MPSIYYNCYRKESNPVDSDSDCSCGECVCDSSYSSSCCSSDCSCSSPEVTPRFEVLRRKRTSKADSPGLKSPSKGSRQGKQSVFSTPGENGETAIDENGTNKSSQDGNLENIGAKSPAKRPCTPENKNCQTVDFTVDSGDMQKEIDEIETILIDSYLQEDLSASEDWDKTASSDLRNINVPNYTDTSYYSSGYSTDQLEGHTPSSQGTSTVSDINGRVVFSTNSIWPSGFNNFQWNVEDDREYEISELYAMLVSLDLPTYMYVIENVLDECVRREIESVQ